MLKYVENKRFIHWHTCNLTSLDHLPMVFMGKQHHFLKNLALFLQNSINTNRVEHNLICSNLETKVIAIVVKLTSKFFKKMEDHIDDDSFPKEEPAFARNLFTEQLPGKSSMSQSNIVSKRKLISTSPIIRSNNWKPHGKMLMIAASKWACSR
jgi:hypothetical protein